MYSAGMESGIRVVGLSMRDFTPGHVLHALGYCLACLLGFSALHFWIWKRTKSRSIRSLSTLAILAAWGCAYYFGQPRHPYWVHEFAVMAYCMSTWHLVDWMVYRLHESIPAHIQVHHLLLDEALVLRPFLLRHKVGGRQPSGRTLQQRVVDVVPFVWRFTLNYMGCEALNAYLMRQSADDVLHGPFLFRMASTFAFGMTLYYHLGYFYYLLAILSVLLLDHVPEDWPPAFNKPWAAANPTEFWNERWHSMFKHWFTRLVYKPTRDSMYWLLAHKPALIADAGQTAVKEPDMQSAAAASSLGVHSGTQQQQQGEVALNSSPLTGLRRRRHASHAAGCGGFGNAQSHHVRSSSQDSGSCDGGSSSSTLCSTELDSCEAVQLESNGTGQQGAQQTDDMVSVDGESAHHEMAGDAAAVVTVVGSTSMKDDNAASASIEDDNTAAGSATAAVSGKGASSASDPPAAASPPGMAGTGSFVSAHPPSTGRVSSSTFPSQALRSGRGTPRSPVAKLLIQAVPVMAVFMWSGLFHELLLKAFFGAATGEQFFFFVLHGFACIMHRMWHGEVQQQQAGHVSQNPSRRRWWQQRRSMPRWLGVALFNAFCCATAMVWFIKPWFRFEYHKELRVPVPGPVNHAVNYLLDQLSNHTAYRL